MKKILIDNLFLKFISLALSLVFLFQFLIYQNNYKLDFLNNINWLLFLVIFVLLSVGIFYFLNFILSKIKLRNFKQNKFDKIELRKIFIVSFISMFVIWMICYIVTFPGGGDYDTYFQLSAPGAASTQHPIGYSYLLNFFIVKLGYNLLGSSVAGWGIFTMLQMLFVIFTLSYTNVFLAKRGCSKRILYILTAFYMFIPIYAVYSVFAVKDVMFATLLIYLFMFLVKLVESDGKILKDKKYMIIYILLSSVLFIIRSNEIVTYLLITIVVCICYKRFLNKILLLCLLIPILFNFSVNVIISSRYNVKHYFQESMAIPLQQISATIYSDRKLSSSELDMMSHLLDLKEIKKSYNVGSVDAIKWHKDFDREYLQVNKIRFLKNWFTMLVKNFDIYVESYALQTYGYWSFGLLSDNGMFSDTQSDTQNDFIESKKKQYNIYFEDLLPDNIQHKFDSFYDNNVRFLSGGTCFWILMFLILILKYNKQSRYIIVMLPLLSVWISMMVAAPISSSVRYMYSFTLLLPILFIYTFLKKSNLSKKKSHEKC